MVDFTNCEINNFKYYGGKMKSNYSRKGKIFMKKKLIISLFVIILYFCVFTTKAFATIEVNFINQSGQTDYEWKNNKVYMETQTIELVNGAKTEKCNVVFLSIEFWENFYNKSYYDKENQIFYFYGKEENIYVKSNEGYYYEDKNTFNLLQNARATPIVINEKLYIPLCLYRNTDMSNRNFGFNEETNTLIYFGPSKTSEFFEKLEIENVKILEEIYTKEYYYDSDKYLNDSQYISIEFLKNRKDGVFKYYLAEINGNTNVIKVIYKYDALRKKYLYDRYEIISKEKNIEGEIVKKINNKFIIVKKDNKYSLYDVYFNMLLENIYDEMVFEEGIRLYKNEENNSLNNQLMGDFIKVKKDNKYALYLLDEKRFVLQEKYYDQIGISNEIDVYRMYDDFSKLEKDRTYNISNVYSKDGKIGLIINNDLVTDIKYTKIEAIETSYTYWGSDDLIIPDNRIIAWKLYVDDEFYILTDIANNNEYFDVLSENIFISKNSYKSMNIIGTENKYTVYGIDSTNKETELYNVEKLLEQPLYDINKPVDIQENKNYYIYFSIAILLIIVICIVKKIRRKTKLK